MDNYQVISERMKKVGELKNDSELARKLGVTPQAMSNYKRKGKMPGVHIFKFADMYGVSLNWLVYGIGNTYNQAIASIKRDDDYHEEIIVKPAKRLQKALEENC